MSEPPGPEAAYRTPARNRVGVFLLALLAAGVVIAAAVVLVLLFT